MTADVDTYVTYLATLTNFFGQALPNVNTSDSESVGSVDSVDVLEWHYWMDPALTKETSPQHFLLDSEPASGALIVVGHIHIEAIHHPNLKATLCF